jgi:predicted ATP-grasp superfamily ATP-dependent carboligase
VSRRSPLHGNSRSGRSFAPSAVDRVEVIVESVLVLDGNQRSALAVTRSLGRRNIRVVVADSSARSLAGSSRHCTERFAYPSPRQEPRAFLECVAAECRRRRIDVLYPMSDVSMYHVLKDRDRLGPVVIPYGPFEAYERLSDKWHFFQLVTELGLPKPVTHFVEHSSALDQVERELRFPVVIKPYRSQLWARGRWLHARVHYADSFDELKSITTRVEYLAGQRFLLQEYIHGENQGIFALADRGLPEAYFANRRIRDVPPEGGIVVLAESIPMNPTTRGIAERLLSHVGWNGVAMIECKIRDGQPYILEANARFWASTQLAVDCGVDYPWLLYQLATGRPRDAVGPYEEWRCLRDLLGDIEHYYMNLARLGLNRYESDEEQRRALRGFWTPLERRTYYEKNRWSDPAPFLCELASSARHLHPIRMARHVITGFAQRWRHHGATRASVRQACPRDDSPSAWP